MSLLVYGSAASSAKSADSTMQCNGWRGTAVRCKTARLQVEMFGINQFTRLSRFSDGPGSTYRTSTELAGLADSFRTERT